MDERRFCMAPWAHLLQSYINLGLTLSIHDFSLFLSLGVVEVQSINLGCAIPGNRPLVTHRLTNPGGLALLHPPPQYLHVVCLAFSPRSLDEGHAQEHESSVAFSH